MKWLTIAVLIGALAGAPASNLRAADAPQEESSSSRNDPDFDEGTRFIFHAVLDGLYEDGVSNADVDQMLLRKPGQAYFHFIYACPVCTATIWALQAYRSRPDAFYSLKDGHAATFGPGLSGQVRAQLYDPDPRVQLGAINTLIRRWMAQRMDLLRLTSDERASLLKQLEAMRKRGMDYLTSFRRQEQGIEMEAPAYVDIDECAVCNGAVGKPMKLPDKKPAGTQAPQPH